MSNILQNAQRGAFCKDRSGIILTSIKLPFVIKIFVLSIVEWPFNTGFTVCCFISDSRGHTQKQLAQFSFYGIG